MISPVTETTPDRGAQPERHFPAVQDDVWGRLQETRRVQRAKLDDFYDNRRMSQMVRGMIKDGKVEEARGLCRQQTEEKLAQLSGDAPYRAHYNLLWQQQRTQPISLGGDCDLGTGYVEPSLDVAPSPPSKATKVCCRNHHNHPPNAFMTSGRPDSTALTTFHQLPGQSVQFSI